MKKFSIIIINYFQKDFVSQCVDSVYNILKSCSFEVIVINNSPEEDLTDLQLKHSGLKLIHNENRGFSQANNLAASLSSGEFLFFLNADALIKNDFLESFVSEFSGKKFGAAGLKLLNSDGTFQLSFWKENNFANEIKNKKEEQLFKEKNLNYINEKENEFKKLKEVDWVSGAAMIVRKDVFDNAGGFDENYFLFYEDADLCKTLSDKGCKNYFFPFGEIIHFKGENVNKDFKSNAYYYSKESQLIYYKKRCSFLDNLLLRIYLLLKFSFLYLTTFNKINLKIIKLIFGIRSRKS